MKFPRPIIIVKTILAFFIVMLIICLLAGCSDSPGYSRFSATKTNEVVDVDFENNYFHVIKINGCEYFYFNNTYGDSLSHKGDCSNPIHRFGLSNAERPETGSEHDIPDGYVLVDQFTYNKNEMFYSVNVYRKRNSN